jgi:NADH dehydrogenase
MFRYARGRLSTISQFTRSYASEAAKPKSKFRKLAWTGGLAATAIGVACYLSQDEEIINTAEGAHLNVPEEAFNPKLGGFKQLPVVSHCLDDSIHNENTKPRLVVIGSGWGAVSVLDQLEKDDYNVTVISDTNYFLFTPLLPSATVGTLEMR